MVVFDPKTKFTITRKKLDMTVDDTPYEGMNVTEMPLLVYSQGANVAEWDRERMKFVGKPGPWPIRETGTFSGLLDHSDRQYLPETHFCSGPWSAILTIFLFRNP